MKNNYKKWSKEEIKYLNEKYGILTCYEMSKKLNKSPKAIVLKARKVGLRSNLPFEGRNLKNKVNETYFSKPTLENCYWGGFIAADGCIYKSKKGNPKPSLEIALNKKDTIILERFKKDIKFSGPIRDRKKLNQKIITFRSNIVCSDLHKHFNITPRKSLTLKPPNLYNTNHKLSYIIGLIDGDGSICLYKNKICFNIAGTKKTLLWVHSVLSSSLPNLTFKRAPITSHGKIDVYQLNGKKAEIVIKFLKKIKVNKLDRKWDKVN